MAALPSELSSEINGTLFLVTVPTPSALGPAAPAVSLPSALSPHPSQTLAKSSLEPEQLVPS